MATITMFFPVKSVLPPVPQLLRIDVLQKAEKQGSATFYKWHEYIVNKSDQRWWALNFFFYLVGL